MRKLILLLALCAIPAAAKAGPFLVTDVASGIIPTHCGVYFDGSTTAVLSPVDSTLACRHDLSTIAVGAHTVQATFIIVDPLWGNREGPKSSPLAFTRPATVSAVPSTLRLVP